MSGLEVALIIVVVIWSFIFLIVAIALIFLFWQAKKGIEKINRILENAQNIIGDIAGPLGKAVAGASYLKDAFNSVVKFKKSRIKKVKIIKK